jgi:hypothetical protein
LGSGRRDLYALCPDGDGHVHGKKKPEGYNQVGIDFEYAHIFTALYALGHQLISIMA